MKRIVMLLLTILLTRIMCFSQTTSTEIKQDSIVFITSEQLKYTNLIFVEHEKLLIENDLLNTQIYNLECKIENYKELDTIRVEQIQKYKSVNNIYFKQIQDLNKNISSKNKTILGLEIGGVTVTVGLLLFILLK